MAMNDVKNMITSKKQELFEGFDSKDKKLFKEFILSRNLTYGTAMGYKYVIKTYINFTNKTLKKLLVEAEKEEDEGVRWKHRTLKKRLITFRSYLYENYLNSTAKTHFGKILTIYKHFEIEIHELPKISRKNIKQSTPIIFKDLPTKEQIKEALKITTPVMRAIILFMTSSGCAKKETTTLTIGDFIEATKEYHSSDNIADVLNELKNHDNIIPMFRLKRHKTGKYYYTFCSPEATTEIMSYLIGIDKPLKNDDKLFKIGKYYLFKAFNDINEKLNLGKTGEYSSLRSHMLRKFHASHLYNSGMSIEEVDALQGRGKDSTHSSYFMEDPQKLKDIYIEHMNSVTINLDVNNLDLKSPEYVQLETEYENEKRSNQEKIKELEEKFETLSQSMLDKIL